MSLGQKDLHNNLKVSVALESQTIDSDTNTDGEIIDVQGFGSLEIVFQTGDLADGAFACHLYHGDDDGLSDAALVLAADLIGSEPSFDDSEFQTVKSVGYKGAKRYVRARVVSTSTTDGGVLSALAIQGSARNAPVV
jgi:hypothetical protein